LPVTALASKLSGQHGLQFQQASRNILRGLETIQVLATSVKLIPITRIMTTLGTAFSIFLIFFGLHTGIALAAGNSPLVPYVVTFIGAVGVLLLNLHRISFRIVALFGVLAVLLAIFAGITAQKDGDFPQHVVSSVLLLYSLALSYGAFLGLQVIGIRRASRFFLLISIVLIVGSTLELYGGLKPASDAFRKAVDFWRPNNVYDADLRDIEMYGGVRPKFLASEPAVLGTVLGIAILSWFLSARRYTAFRFLGFTLLILPAFALVRSPEILICFTVACLFFLLEIGPKRWSGIRARCLGAVALLAMLIAPAVISSNTNYGQGGSFFMREVAPPAITALVLRSQPLLGTGIGGWAQVVPFGSEVFNKAPGSIYRNMQHKMLDPDIAKSMVHSAAWEFWCDLGLLGGILVIWILTRALKELRVPQRFFIFSCGALIFTMSGAMDSPRVWIYLFTVACVYQMHTEALSEELQPVALSNEVFQGFPRQAV
jgi:hypothetical protein